MWQHPVYHGSKYPSWMWLDEAEVSVLPAPAGTLILKEGPGAASGTGGAGVGEVAVPFTAASEELAAALLTLPDVAGVQVSPAPSFFGWSSWDVTFTHVNQRQLVPMLSGEGLATGLCFGSNFRGSGCLWLLTKSCPLHLHSTARFVSTVVSGFDALNVSIVETGPCHLPPSSSRGALFCVC